MINNILNTAALAALFTIGTPMPAKAADIARYNVGSVPDQTVWDGSSRSFLLHWDEQPGVTMAYTASPKPAGGISLAPTKGDDWEFSFSPAETDENPVTITLTASRSGESTVQSWVMEPQQVLQPEEAYFNSGPHTQAAATRHGISVYEGKEAVARSLNYSKAKQLTTVRIIGETVELEAGHANGLAEYFDRTDVASVEIIAERVIVRDVMKAKQCDVTIWASELVFEDDGKIVTTPEEKSTSPGTSGDGSNGLDAGDVTLYVGEVSAKGNATRFDLSGGRGQSGGPGEHGQAKGDVSSRWNSVKNCDSGACKTHTPNSGYTIIYWQYRLAGVKVKDGGKESGWPKDGSDAKPSGKPGTGGDGGTVRSTFDVSRISQLYRGATPAPTFPTTWPKDKYQGGRAGYPVKSEKVKFWYVPFKMKSEASSRHTSYPGEDAPVKKNSAVGAEGSFEALPANPFAWVHPLSLAKVVQHVRDDYLGDRTVLAQTRLEEYEAVLSSYRSLPFWESLGAKEQMDIIQFHDEMRLLLQQIEAGLDYYGNPPAWVPMLSFEVNQTLFQNELDRAMDTLYLAHWIGGTAKTQGELLAARTELRDTVRADLEQAKLDYNEAVTKLPLLRQEAAKLDGEIQTTQNDLEIEELKLLNDTREEDWVTGLRLGLKLSATICQMVPVYQPALGLVGEGLRAGSNFNPDRPWDSIKDAKGIAAAYQEADFETSANEQQEAAEGVDPEAAEENSIDYAAALQQAATGLSNGIADMSEFIAEREVPSEEMLAELERLKSLSPEYTALIERVEGLTERNAEFAVELVGTMQKIGRLSSFMSRSVLAIDALSADIAPAATVLDDRATAYLDEMERRAFDRLVKYHYYLAKAYEYRLLEPYTEPLDLTGLFEKFEQYAALNPDHTVTPDQFDSFKSIYQEKLSDVAETIFTRYNNNRPDLSVPVRFNLFPEEIDTLNEGGTVKLNLRDAGFFQPSEENVRIVDLRIHSIEAGPRDGGRLGRTAFVDLNIEHPGVSRLKQDGETYLFRHYNRSTDNPFVWGGRYDVIDNQIDPFTISEASDSLLRSLLKSSSASDMLLYSRPSAWTDLEISRSVISSGGAPIDISSVRLELIYDFTPRAQSAQQRDLEVFIHAVSENGQGQKVAEMSDFQPYFNIGAPDSNGRKDARGKFLRVFDSASGPVTVTAPASYGNYNFAGWTDEFGQELPGGPYLDPTYTAPLPTDTVLVARYSESAPRPVTSRLVLNTPVLSGNQLLLSWAGGAGIRLQSTSDLASGAWSDVPGSNGRSSISVPRSGSGQFFRLAR